MSNELIISATQDGCRIALLKDKTLVEFHQEAEGSKFTVGDIFLGTVKKVVPGLNAAFIDVGYDKDAFLHYLDLGPQFSSLQKFTKLVRSKKFNGGRLDKFHSEPDIDKHGKIVQQLTKNQVIPVQIVKEPISTKGPRLSCELSLAGRYLFPLVVAAVILASVRTGCEQSSEKSFPLPYLWQLITIHMRKILLRALFFLIPFLWSIYVSSQPKNDSPSHNARCTTQAPAAKGVH